MVDLSSLQPCSRELQWHWTEFLVRLERRRFTAAMRCSGAGLTMQRPMEPQPSAALESW
jgi:hypothetical protein